MRAYVGVTAQEVKDLLESGQLDVSDVYAATGVFIAQNNDLNEEEIEYTLSLIAAEDAVELKSSGTGSACVLAFEVPDGIISETYEMSISLSAPLTWEYLECCFEVSDDGEELTWFATQEIANNISAWLA
ncbi:MAG: hypothetical protein F2896_02325 [Actinobacteria bacterium]|jgi:hypothetical protein|uniref:Unannotated protein n=1 Tax=freshwater metagenome TaxID=449393 RepID=A0A6J5YUQ9_9ZZZZ|nr:hypothetical protein [Actinomycetota bacterium]